ncbi:unnamed protein product [Darwinula stevensoni]|uniref:Uncharacterized protein n=1 Tax=Darwinula stevensoni TaxID=69355 RepID=A0A7R9AAE2_9CRUS|nr:unnamed protein product [Darwinula stevensoni]CAG0898348.1 unnamed protein product [Darwinula stevensoni]
MKIPVVKRCCCGCMSNKNGSIAIGILMLIISSSIFVTDLLEMAGYTKRAQYHAHLSGEGWGYLLMQFEEFTRPNIFEMVLLPLSIIPEALLIHGVRKRKRKLLIPWLFLDFLALTASLILLLVIFLVLVVLLVMMMNILIFILFIVGIVAVFLAYYVAVHFFLVVYSYFKVSGCHV